MPSPTPELDLAEISGWIRQAADAAATSVEGLERSVSGKVASDASAADFKRAKQALQRARTKTAVKAPPPFRRLRRNQAAVNEGLIDACASLIAVSKKMADEIAALSTDLANLRRYLAQREAAEDRRAPNPDTTR